MSKEVNDLYNLKSRNESENFAIGERMLKIAKNDFDKSVAYTKMGDAAGKLGNYKQGIFYLNTAILYAQETNSLKEQILINNILSQVYERIGMTNKADECLQQSKELALKLNDFHYLNMYYAFKMANDMDRAHFKEAILCAHKVIDYIEKIPESSPEQAKNIKLSLNEFYEGLSVMHMKSNEWDKALQYLEKAEHYKNLLPKTDYNIGNFYYRSRALLFAKQGNAKLSRKHFDSAYSMAVKRNNIVHRIKILEDRILTKVDKGTPRYEDLTEMLLDLNKIKANEQSKAIIQLDVNSENKVFKFQERTKKTLVFSSLITLLLTGSIYYLKERNRKLKIRFQTIIKDLEDRKSKDNNNLPVKIKNNTAENENNSENQSQNELSIIKQLEKLEEKLFFTSKNVSATQLAAMLKITPRNLSYILKKYRNGDFYSYMNLLRINYSTLLLRENSKYRNYKLNVISDICGYNSYSQFTLNFKSITGLSPSQFIAFLQDDQDE